MSLASINRSVFRARTAFQLLVLSLTIVLASNVVLAEEPQDFIIPGSEFERSLFDGQSLHGWIVENQCEVDVVDGAMRLKSGTGWIRHETPQRNFKLHLEWKALKLTDYDAGIIFGCSKRGDPIPKDGYRVSLKQGQVGTVSQFPELKRQEPKPDGEWNVLDLYAFDSGLVVNLNRKGGGPVGTLKDCDGWLGLQVNVPEGGQFLFRNIQLTEMNRAPLFNGRDLAGWEGVGGAADECWSVADGLLTCSGKKGPWLRSTREYDDFNLRLEYRLSKGGNSGVYVRVPADGNHHRDDETQPPAGFEVQVLDDFAPEHAALKDFQYSASIYDFAGANPRNSRPRGEWNSLEINCLGQHITTWHNGERVTNITDLDVPALALRSTKGFLGLQNHNTVVAFRNIRVGPAVKVSSDSNSN